MLLTSRGIVLQSFKYGENSLISKVISRDRGIITLLSNKTKAKKNKQGNFFEPLSAVQFVCYISNKSDLHRVKEITYNNSIPLAPESVTVHAVRFFLAEFLSKVIREQEQNFTLFDFIESRLSEMNTSPEIPSFFHIKFITELMDILGIQPYVDETAVYLDLQEGEGCFSKPSHSNFFNKQEIELYLLGKNNPTALKRNERSLLLNLLLIYYDNQLGGIANIKSKAVLEIVFG
ncbi:MAG: DNA repair protein RecO (recombination protein O) [Vicingaceae bacterium]|jgi:DNA repair protein RecO (recombination protein O)